MCSALRMYHDTKCRLCGKEEETQEQCRLCGKEEETQGHALETYKGIEPFNIGKGTTRNIFEIMENFQVGLPPGARGPADPGVHTN